MESQKKLDPQPPHETEESKIIAQIDFNNIDYKEMALYAYNHCDLCGGPLEFFHVGNFMDLTMEEEKYCPTCNIHSDKTWHKIQ
ncbi:MAG: hypothetical protein KDD61_17100 [Bdellovibrionales bacterium]|nr:hypothetical protein [Bdellovibrionales bacterium]